MGRNLFDLEYIERVLKETIVPTKINRESIRDSEKYLLVAQKGRIAHKDNWDFIKNII